MKFQNEMRYKGFGTFSKHHTAVNKVARGCIGHLTPNNVVSFYQNVKFPGLKHLNSILLNSKNFHTAIVSWARLETVASPF